MYDGPGELTQPESIAAAEMSSFVMAYSAITVVVRAPARAATVCDANVAPDLVAVIDRSPTGALMKNATPSDDVPVVEFGAPVPSLYLYVDAGELVTFAPLTAAPLASVMFAMTRPLLESPPANVSSRLNVVDDSM